MKILFVNAPVVLGKYSSPQNNFKINGYVVPGSIIHFPGADRFFSAAKKLFGLGQGVRYGVRAGSRWPFTMDAPLDYAPFPFFMAYAAANLKSHGFDVNIIDAVAEKIYDYETFFERARLESPDIVVVECSTPTIDLDLWVAKRISEFSKVALAGPHLKENAEKLSTENPWITYLLKGEYILSSLKMAQTLKPGIYELEVLKDLDGFPFPFRNYTGWNRYYDPSMPTPRPQLQLYSAKGCPFKCTFCSWPQTMYEGSVALRNPKKISEEIRQELKNHKYNSLFFDDDTFNLGTDRISALCDELKDIGLPWTMMGRLDASPTWLYDKMVDSGCVGMRFGVETFNLDVLKRVKKGIERKDFKGTLQHISEKYPKLMIHLTMMRDMPGQTEEMHQTDMKILADMGFLPTNDKSATIYRNFQLSHCAPFPGTELYDEMVSLVGADKLSDFRKYDGGQTTVMKDIKLEK